MTKSSKTEIVRGSERKEASAVQRVFTLLEDKSFAIHVLDIFVYAMPSGKRSQSYDENFVEIENSANFFN